MATKFLDELNGMEVKTVYNQVAVQMVVLSLFIRTDLLFSPAIEKIVIDMLETRLDLPPPLVHDLTWFIGRKICQLNVIEKA